MVRVHIPLRQSCYRFEVLSAEVAAKSVILNAFSFLVLTLICPIPNETALQHVVFFNYIPIVLKIELPIA
jgi:hypothetical protein